MRDCAPQQLPANHTALEPHERQRPNPHASPLAPLANKSDASMDLALPGAGSEGWKDGRIQRPCVTWLDKALLAVVFELLQGCKSVSPAPT